MSDSSSRKILVLPEERDMIVSILLRILKNADLIFEKKIGKCRLLNKQVKGTKNNRYF